MLFLVTREPCPNCAGTGITERDFVCAICAGDGRVVEDDRPLTDLEAALLQNKREIAALIVGRQEAGRLLDANGR